jgi:phosphopantetheinyl transferase
MPLAKTIIVDENTIVLVWKITETFQELETIFLCDNSIKRLDNMRSELHKKGFISIRHLLKQLNYSDDDLFYTENGKPYLKNGKNISISHSFNFSTIIISDKVIGIDIEKNRNKIKRIAHKFAGQENEFLQEKNLVEQLTVIWGAKESLYKIHPDGGLSFIKHLPVEAFRLEDKETKAWIKKEPWNEPFKILFEPIEDFTLVYALPLN